MVIKTKISDRQILVILTVLYFLTRLLFLTKLPIFNDEATYLDWSYRQINLEGEFFHSVKHAKPPLFIWTAGVVRKIISDPLLAGRLVSVFAGFLAAFGLYKIAEHNFNKKTGYLAFLLYTVIPLFAFFDRQALMESFVAASGVWSFYFFQKMLKESQYKYAAILGIVLGMGYLVKTSAIVFFFAIFALTIFEAWQQKKSRKTILTKTAIVFTAYLITLSPLLLHSVFWTTLEQNRKYIFTLSEIIGLPFKQWFSNFKNFLVITTLYFNPLIFSGGLVSIYLLLKKRKYEIIRAGFIFLVGSVFAVFLARTTSVRYTAPFLPIFLLFPAYLITSSIAKNKVAGVLLLVSSLIPSLILTILLIFSPLVYFNTLDSFSKHSQKEVYVTRWSSGYGFEEVKNYLQDISKNQLIVVAVRLDAGIPENAVFTYFSGSKKILPIYLDKRMIRDYESYNCIKSKVPVYFVSRDNHLGGLDKHFIEIKRVYKPEGEHYIGIHRLKTDCQGKTLNII